MKIILSFFIAINLSTFSCAQDLDSLFYQGIDTAGLTKSISRDEANWNWADTLINKDYSMVDNFAFGLKRNYKNIPQLAKDIAEPFYTDVDKVRAIFIWMTNNIVYDYIEKSKNNRTVGKAVSYSNKTPKSIIAAKWENIYFNYATQVLKKRRGVCEGYATLFYELCKFNGIKCEIVTGFADDNVDKVDNFKKQKTFPTNHAWNRVYIDEEWLYIDVTWASSGTYDGKRTEPTGYSPFYFLVSENNLYSDHIVNEKQTKRRNELVGNY